ncbi:hypothetical protein BDQ17DRAFT_1246269 [Cyathus striatus]|nr:hypothetical protein BDQ17DRAFT_1246269 [Cyathus striatus]
MVTDLRAGACFTCEADSSNFDREPNARTCKYCPNVDTANLSAPELLKHMGAHILHDVRLHNVNNACGLCLSSTNSCIIHLVNKGNTMQISMDKSKCMNLRKFHLKQATKHTDHSPCTNYPIKCNICPDNAPAIWKYNLQSHILSAHPTAMVQNYMRFYDISE